MRPFGRMLWEENARAIVSRNRDRAEGDRLAQAVADYRLRRYIGVTPTGLSALARFLDYQCDEDASFAQANACVALCAITGAVTAAHSMDAIKHAAHLPFGGFKESEVAAFLRPGGIDGARQRTLAGVAFRRRARDTPRLRPTRAGRIIPRRGVSLEEGP